jgi:hypothetical protein
MAPFRNLQQKKFYNFEQEISYSIADFYPNSTSYISASYVKFLESAGARVVPVLINQVKELNCAQQTPILSCHRCLIFYNVKK